MSWPLVKIGDVCSLMTGGTPKTSMVEFYEAGTVPWIVSGDVHKQEIFDCEKRITELAVENSNARYLPKDSVLIALNGQGKTRGTVALLRIEGATCNQSIVAINPNNNDELYSDYLFYYLKSQYRKIRNITGDKDRAGLNMPLIREIDVPLPPLAEQKRIAAILDKADAIRRKRQQAIQLADEFLRSVFLDMFGDPVANPKGWIVEPVKNAIESIRAGWSAKGNNYPCDKDNLGVLKISAVTSGTFRPSENKHVDAEIIPDDKKLIFPRKGDLLFSRANTRELVAATCIVQEDRDDVFLPDKLWLIRCNEDKMLPEFLNYMVWHPRFKELLTSQATGTSGSMLNISKKKFEESCSIFPDIELQQRFADIYWKVQATLNSLNASKAEAGSCFESISQKAFRGGL